MPALIFDCDGVLADTERDGHLPAFNATFKHFDLPVCWSEEEYAQKLTIGGGKERLKSLLTPEFIGAAHLPTDPEGLSDTVASWHAYKTGVYTDLVADGVMPGRPGIARIVTAAHEAGWTLAVASTSHEDSVRAVLEHAVGENMAAHFSVFAGDIVAKKKPAPDIYLLALHELAVPADDAVVVEDSANGLRAAVAAQLRTVVTVSSFTGEEDFTGASLVVSSLGDSPEPAASVLANPHDVSVDHEVTLDVLTQILTTPRP